MGATETQGLSPSATATLQLLPTQSPNPDCSNEAQFVQDVAIPDDTNIPAALLFYQYIYLMTDELLAVVQELDKICPHIEVPVQAGDDEILGRMRRGYSVEDYRKLIERIRQRLPHGSIATDIIVGRR